MKKLFIAVSLVTALSYCNNSKDKPNVAKDKKIAPGDRAGADSSMIDLEDAISANDRISQHWDNKEDAAEGPNAGSSLDMPFRGFYLFSDGNAVKDPRDRMTFGKWTYDDKQKELDLTVANGATEKYNVKSIAFDKLLMSKDGGKDIEYIADGLAHKGLMNDPFYPSNMQWRVKPKTAEDDAALHKRVKGCLHFYYLYYMDNIKRNVAKVSFYGLPTCFKWYAGGIHLMKEKELEKSWTDIFYDPADASKGYVILDKMISKKYVWDEKEPNWVKQNAGVLKQMEAAIDSL